MTTRGTQSGRRGRNKRIGELLVEEGYIDREHLEEALKAQKRQGHKLGETLIDLGYLDIQSFAQFLADQPGIPSIDLSHYRASSELCSLIPREYAITHEVFPIDKMGKLLTVGMACPLDSATIEELEELTGLMVKALLCDARDIRAAIADQYPGEEEPPPPPDPERDVERLESALRLENVARLVRQIDELPTLPETVQRVKEATEDPGVSVADVADIIATDPPIVARALKLANSAAYAFSNRVDSIHLASTLLGLEELSVIVLSSAVIDLVEKSRYFDYETFWQRSIFCATAARRIARARGDESNPAVFTAGLLHDIGRFALAEAVPARYAKIHRGIEGEALLDAEKEALGIAHPEAGHMLARNWRLPKKITEAIRFHHNPDLAWEDKELAAMVALAAHMAEHRGEGDWAGASMGSAQPMLDTLALGREEALAVFAQTVSSL